MAITIFITFSPDQAGSTPVTALLRRQPSLIGDGRAPSKRTGNQASCQFFQIGHDGGMAVFRARFPAGETGFSGAIAAFGRTRA
jgi:hypothetical protein